MKRVFMTLLLAAMLLFTFDAVGVCAEDTPEAFLPRLVSISAVYEGSAVETGHEFDVEKLVVKGHYSDGSSEYLKADDYEISSKIVGSVGTNTFVVLKDGFTAKFFVTGKKLISISVVYRNESCSIGNLPCREDFRVMGYYSNGMAEEITEGYEITSPDMITEMGRTPVAIRYREFTERCLVLGVEAKKPVSLSAKYEEDSVVAGEKLDRNKVSVTAIYADGSVEKITTFGMTPDSFAKTGKQKITVDYLGVSKDIEIEATENYPVKLEAEYTGKPVVIGKNVFAGDISVTVTYKNGMQEKTEDFTTHSRKIRYVGDNSVKVYFGSTLSAEVIVKGIELSEPDFNYTSELSATNGTDLMKIVTAIATYLDKDCLVAKSLKKTAVKKAYKKLKLKKGEYIAFTYEFSDDNNEDELPVTVRITIPESFDIAHTFLYYTPNKKTILGKTNRTVTGDDTFEAELFKTGTYMLVYSEELEPEAEAEDETSPEEDEYL